MSQVKQHKEPLLRIAKRDAIATPKAWGIRVIGVLLSLVVSGLFIFAVTKLNPVQVYEAIFDGAFGTSRRSWVTIRDAMMLLCIGVGLAPAFKMKFWNLGGNGQVLIGCLACAMCMYYLGGEWSDPLVCLLMFVASVAAGAVWAVIPAVFKAFFNTNESLFTLMMNYVAMQLVAICIFAWVPSGSGVLGRLPYGSFPKIGGEDYILNIIIVAVLVVLMFLYFRFSKHGYEISVVGESENTAKYVGINVKKVIIRTMVLSGAICGLAGLLLVAGTDHSLTTITVDGRGFTAILVAWLGKFNPFGMSFTSLLYVIIEMGSGQAASTFKMSEYFSDIITGIFFFLVIGCEFFINYKIKFRPRKKKAENPVEEVAA